MSNADTASLSWVVTDLAARVAGVRSVAAVTGDGRVVASSGALSSRSLENLAGIYAGIAGLFAGWVEAKRYGPATLTMVEMDAGFLLLMAISSDLWIAAWMDRTGDVEHTAYELAQVVDRFAVQVRNHRHRDRVYEGCLNAPAAE